MSEGQYPYSPPRAPPHGFPHFLFAAAAQQNQLAATIALDSFFQQQQQQQQQQGHLSSLPQAPPRVASPQRCQVNQPPTNIISSHIQQPPCSTIHTISSQAPTSQANVGHFMGPQAPPGGHLDQTMLLHRQFAAAMAAAAAANPNSLNTLFGLPNQIVTGMNSQHELQIGAQESTKVKLKSEQLSISPPVNISSNNKLSGIGAQVNSSEGQFNTRPHIDGVPSQINQIQGGIHNSPSIGGAQKQVNFDTSTQHLHAMMAAAQHQQQMAVLSLQLEHRHQQASLAAALVRQQHQGQSSVSQHQNQLQIQHHPSSLLVSHSQLDQSSHLVAPRIQSPQREASLVATAGFVKAFDKKNL